MSEKISRKLVSTETICPSLLNSECPHCLEHMQNMYGKRFCCNCGKPLMWPNKNRIPTVEELIKKYPSHSSMF